MWHINPSSYFKQQLNYWVNEKAPNKVKKKKK